MPSAHRPLHKVISAGDFRGVGVAPVSHIVPVSLWRDKGGQCVMGGKHPYVSLCPAAGLWQTGSPEERLKLWPYINQVAFLFAIN